MGEGEGEGEREGEGEELGRQATGAEFSSGRCSDALDTGSGLASTLQTSSPIHTVSPVQQQGKLCRGWVR